MKLTSKTFLLTLFFYCSQALICMEKMSLDSYKATTEGDKYGTHLVYSIEKINDPFNRYKDDPNEIILFEKQLEKNLEDTIRNTKRDTISNNKQMHIIYNDHHKPDYFSYMLQAMLQQNNLEPKKIMSRDGTSGIKLDHKFIEPLSLEAQETFYAYLVNIVLHPHSTITNNRWKTEEDCMR